MQTRNRRRSIPNIWPGFVDAISALLIITIFLLMVFTIGQNFLSDMLLGRDKALSQLNQKLAEISKLFAIEKNNNDMLNKQIAGLISDLEKSKNARDELGSSLSTALNQNKELRETLLQSQKEVADASIDLANAFKDIEADQAKIKTQIKKLEILGGDVASLKQTQRVLKKEALSQSTLIDDLKNKSRSLRVRLSKQVELTSSAKKKAKETQVLLERITKENSVIEKNLRKEKELSDQSKTQINLLNRQISALKQRLEIISKLLQSSEANSIKQKIQITNLGKRLNAALASKVQELSRYRSEFFGKLRDIIGTRQDIRISGDRFIFQSEVLFASASSEIRDSGRLKIVKLAQTLLKISEQIPSNIDWVLQVDGHTDRLPINTEKFPSNWELSTARAISVVKLLIANGLPAKRLVAAGYGEFHPIDKTTTMDSRKRNRRIELKLTSR